MSLINCPDCSTEVSSRADTCPKCGFPMYEAPINVEENQKKNDDVSLGYVIIGITTIGGFVATRYLIPEGVAEWPVRSVVIGLMLFGFWKGYSKLD